MSVRGCLRTFIYLVSLPLGASFLYVHINPYIYIFVFPCPFLNFSFFLFFGHKIGTSKSGKFKLQQRNSKCKQLKKKGKWRGDRKTVISAIAQGFPRFYHSDL